MNKQAGPLPFAFSPATGAPALPLTLGQVLDRTFRLVNSNLRHFVQISAIPAVIYFACSVLMLPTWMSTVRWLNAPSHQAVAPVSGPRLAAAAVCALVMIAAIGLCQAATSYAAVQLNAGIRVTPTEAWRVAMQRSGRYVWLIFLRMLVPTVPAFAATALVEIGVIFLIASGSGPAPSSSAVAAIALSGLLFVAEEVWIVVAAVRLALVCPVSIAENRSAWSSLSRSNRLTKGARGRIFLAGLIVIAATYAVLLGMALIVLAFLFVGVWVIQFLRLPMASWGSVWAAVVGLILLISVFFMTAFASGAFETIAAVLYHDQLLRNEGLAPAPLPVLQPPA
jgi:hypothetical protein